MSLNGVEQFNVTEEFAKYVNDRVVNKTKDQDLMTWRDNTDGNGNGNKLKAKGDAKIDSAESHEGEVQKLVFTGQEQYNLWKFNLKLTYRYSSTTHGETWTCAFNKCTTTNNEWGEVHPKGTIIATFYSVPQQNLEVKLDVVTDPDHDDRPGKFIQEQVATKFREDICKAAEEFTGLNIANLQLRFYDDSFRRWIS
ncbi:hypothetical protein [Priestia aryabhattai]|uniref:hypothetical protein n=1 Tax=Priestia aryabhattai TaxID=412384 RepID=UPI003D282588